MTREIQVDVAVIGAGTAGLFAMRQVRRAGKSFVMIDPGPLGTTCARVGCMPSKVALHAAHLWADRVPMAEHGVRGTEHLSVAPDAAWTKVRAMRDRFAGRTAENSRKAMGEHLLEGPARLREPTVVEVEGPQGPCTVRAGAVILANGSRPVKPKWLDALGDRVITTDELFELETLPRSLGVLGLGAIGLEMGLALARLGVRVVGSDIARWPAGLTDPELGQRVVEQFSGDLPMWLEEAARLTPEADGVRMETAQGQEKVERILAAMGRRSNIDTLDPEGKVLPLAEDGLPPVDPATMQVGDLPVFIAGDANGRRLLMHEAGDEGSIAGYNAARGTSQRFRRRTPLAIAFTQPDIVSVGTPLSELDPERVLVGTAEGSGNGRSVILEAQDSMVRLYADADTGRLRGAALSAAGGEHLGHLLAWAIQRGETAQQLLSMPFYHPVVEEVVQEALQDLVGQLPGSGDLPAGLEPEA